jgi:hypothetical protein
MFAVDTTCDLLPASAVYIGYEVQVVLDSLNLPRVTVDIFRSRCLNFLMDLTKQIKMRLPGNVKVMQHIDMLSPHNATAQPKMSIVTLAAHFKDIVNSVDATEKEWNQLSDEVWSFTDDINKSWVKVYNDVNAVGERRYHNVGALALALLCLPYSNATVERVFSQNECRKKQIEKSDFWLQQQMSFYRSVNTESFTIVPVCRYVEIWLRRNGRTIFLFVCCTDMV